MRGEPVRGGRPLADLDRRARGVAEALTERGCRGEPVFLGFPPGVELLRGAARFQAVVASAQPRVFLTPCDGTAQGADDITGEGVEWLGLDQVAHENLLENLRTRRTGLGLG